MSGDRLGVGVRLPATDAVGATVPSRSGARLRRVRGDSPGISETERLVRSAIVAFRRCGCSRPCARRVLNAMFACSRRIGVAARIVRACQRVRHVVGQGALRPRPLGRSSSSGKPAVDLRDRRRPSSFPSIACWISRIRSARAACDGLSVALLPPWRNATWSRAFSFCSPDSFSPSEIRVASLRFANVRGLPLCGDESLDDHLGTRGIAG